MGLLLTQDERILLHLARFQRFRQEWEVPAEACQEGIGERLDILVNNVSRSLKGLLAEGLVEERLAHVRGRPRRLKTYFLTERGLRSVGEVERRLRAARVAVEREGSRKELVLGDLASALETQLNRRVDLLALADAVREGKTREDDLRVAVGDAAAEPRPSFVERLVGMPPTEGFVGRTGELARIAAAFGERRRAAVVLWGMPGIGKSTLAARALEAVRGSRHFLWHRCTEWDTGRSLVALLAEFLQAAGRSRLAAARRLRWSSPSELLAPLAADLRELPVLLVLDDLQKLPTEASALLALVLEASRGSGAHLLLVSRTLPQFYGRGEAAPAGPVVEIAVGNLRAEEARPLLPDLPAERFEQVYAVTEGHPLFLRLVAAGEAADGDLPRYIEQEIWQRMSEEERLVLRGLGIHRLPVAIDALPNPAAIALGALKNRGVVTESRGLFEVHDLLREFVLSRLPRDERLALHAQAAAYWQPRDPSESLHHLLAAEAWPRAAALAVEILPAVAEEDPAEALHLAERFPQEHVDAALWPDLLYVRGLAKERLGDARGALALYREAMVLEEGRGGDKASLAVLQQRIAQTERETASYEEALEAHEKALRLFVEAGDREGGVLEHVNIATLHRRHGAADRARESLERALSEAKQAQNPAAVPPVLYQLAITAREAGDLATAVARFREAEKAAAQAEDREGEIRARGGLLEVEYVRGNRTRAAQLAGEVESALGTGASGPAREVLLSYARLLRDAGDLEGALKTARTVAAHPATRLLGRPRPEVADLEARSLAAGIARDVGRWKEMESERAAALKAAWSLNRPSWVGREFLEQALDAEARGDLDAAVGALESAHRVLAPTPERRGLAAVSLTWGRILEKKEDLRGAEEKYRRAAEMAEAAGDLLGRARALEAFGEVVGPRGKETLREARGLYVQLGRREDQARIDRLLGGE